MGAIHTPGNTLSFSGNASSQQVMIVADKLTMNGHVTLDLTPDLSTPIAPQIAAALIG